MNTLYIALVVAVVGPVILSILQGRQRKAEKEQDYERQDAVAAEALRQQDEVAAQAAEAAQLLADRQDEIARQAEGVAQLLLEAQQKTTMETGEVARLAATQQGFTRVGQIALTLSYPNGNRENICLAEVPRVGESIRLKNGVNEPWHIVEHVLWVEGTDPPHVIVSVHPRVESNETGGRP